MRFDPVILSLPAMSQITNKLLMFRYITPVLGEVYVTIAGTSTMQLSYAQLLVLPEEVNLYQWLGKGSSTEKINFNRELKCILIIRIVLYD